MKHLAPPCRHTENVEVVVRDELDGRSMPSGSCRDVQSADDVGSNNVRKRLRGLRERLVLRIRGTGPAFAHNLHELLRPFYPEGVPPNRLQQAKHRRVRTDPEREGE